MAKLKVGDVLGCTLEGGCEIKIKVLEVCEEVDCDLLCCGKEMQPVEGEVECPIEGDIYTCCFDSGCGLTVQVIQKCEEAECDLVCCGQQMTKKECAEECCLEDLELEKIKLEIELLKLQIDLVKRQPGS